MKAIVAISRNNRPDPQERPASDSRVRKPSTRRAGRGQQNSRSTAPAANKPSVGAPNRVRPNHPKRHALDCQLCHSTNVAPVGSHPRPLHLLTTRCSAAQTVTVPAGNRLFFAVTPDARTVFAGFHVPVGNAIWGHNYFIPESGNVAAGHSFVLWSTSAGSSANDRGFANTSHAYYTESGAKGIVYATPAGLRPDQLVNGPADAEAAATEASSDGLMTMESFAFDFDVSTVLSGQATVHVCSTDTLTLPNSTTVFAPDNSNMTSDFCLRFRKPVTTSGSTCTFQDIMNGLTPHQVCGASQKHFQVYGRMIAPTYWKSGGNDGVAPGTIGAYTGTEATTGRFPTSNPFAGTSSTGMCCMVEAIGADCKVSIRGRLVNAYEHAPRFDTSSVDAQLRNTAFGRSLHTSVPDSTVREGKLMPTGHVGVGSTRAEASASLMQEQLSHAGVAVPIAPVVPTQTKILAPPPETTVHKIEETIHDVGEVVSSALDAGANIAGGVKKLIAAFA